MKKPPVWGMRAAALLLLFSAWFPVELAAAQAVTEVRTDAAGHAYSHFRQSYSGSEFDSHGAVVPGGSFTVSRSNAKGETTAVFRFVEDGVSQEVVYTGLLRYYNVAFDYKGVAYEVGMDCCMSSPEGSMVGIYLSSVDGGGLHVFGVPASPSRGSSGPVAVPVEWQRARTLQGVFGECGGYDGTVQLKCGKANKSGIAKVSMAITPFSGRRRSFPAVAVDVSGGTVEAAWPTLAYAVKISGNEFSGEPVYSGFRPACSPDAVWSADVGFPRDGSYYFDLGPIPSSLFGNLTEYVGSGVTFTVANGKVVCPRNAKVVWERCPPNAFCGAGSWKVDESRGTNVPFLKLSCNPKTGVFKGSFVVRTWTPVGKAYKASVIGVYADGVGMGFATVKNAADWAVYIQ